MSDQTRTVSGRGYGAFGDYVDAQRTGTGGLDTGRQREAVVDENLEQAAVSKDVEVQRFDRFERQATPGGVLFGKGLGVDLCEVWRKRGIRALEAWPHYRKKFDKGNAVSSSMSGLARMMESAGL
ncbi:hypothetical protein LTR50_004572 [Elasticomyces elasticus]|nr:hypothetical protein LTR50_004572 [Elasticomyces elasticus]